MCTNSSSRRLKSWDKCRVRISCRIRKVRTFHRNKKKCLSFRLFTRVSACLIIRYHTCYMHICTAVWAKFNWDNLMITMQEHNASLCELLGLSDLAVVETSHWQIQLRNVKKSQFKDRFPCRRRSWIPKQLQQCCITFSALFIEMLM